MSIGHNSIDGAKLKNVLDRARNIRTEQNTLKTDFNELMTEARSNGLNPKVIRALLKEEERDQVKHMEFMRQLEAYKSALGALATTPLGAAAIKAAEDDLTDMPAHLRRKA